jgi:phospholipid-binding lipoprotein MlaA
MLIGVVAMRPPLWQARLMIARRIAARLLSPIAGALLLSACATVPGKYELAERDPLQKVNRGIWNVNMAADKIVIKPASQVYRAVAPRPVRQGVSNFFTNLTEPWSLINNVLQGKPARAERNLGRFLINSTIGIGGLFDQASKMHVRSAPEDLGQTMAVWGVNGGPYLVLPLLGPSTMRDGIGSGIAAYADPIKIAINQAHVDIWYKRGFLAAQVVSARSDLTESGADTFLQTSLDPYAAARSAYLQRRMSEIADQDDVKPEAASAITPAAPAGGTPLQSAVPLPGDAATPPASGALPQSSAPLPGDDQAAPAAPQPSAGPLPPSAAPLPGDDTPPPADKPRP